MASLLSIYTRIYLPVQTAPCTIHAWAVERQADIAFAIHRNKTARATDFTQLADNRASRFIERLPCPAHPCIHFVTHRPANEIFSVTCGGKRYRLVIRPGSSTDDRAVTNASRCLGGHAARGCSCRQMTETIQCNCSDSAVFAGRIAIVGGTTATTCHFVVQGLATLFRREPFRRHHFQTGSFAKSLCPFACEKYVFGLLHDCTCRQNRIARPANSGDGTACAAAERQKDYVQAALSVPMSGWHVVTRHILPNSLPPLIVVATVQVASAISLEATLSFLGVGLPPTEPSLGMLIANGFQYLLSGRYWISIYPGVALIVLIMAINLMGDQIRDILNPRLRK